MSLGLNRRYVLDGQTVNQDLLQPIPPQAVLERATVQVPPEKDAWFKNLPRSEQAIILTSIANFIRNIDQINTLFPEKDITDFMSFYTEGREIQYSNFAATQELLEAIGAGPISFIATNPMTMSEYRFDIAPLGDPALFVLNTVAVDSPEERRLFTNKFLPAFAEAAYAIIHIEYQTRDLHLPDCIQKLEAAKAAEPRLLYKLSSAEELAAELQDGVDLEGIQFNEDYYVLNDNPTSVYQEHTIRAWFQVACTDPKTRAEVTKVEKIRFLSPCGFHDADTKPVIEIRWPAGRRLPIDMLSGSHFEFGTEYYMVNMKPSNVYDKVRFKDYIRKLRKCQDFNTKEPVTSLRRVVFVTRR